MDGENGGVDVIIGPSTSHQSEIVSGVVKRKNGSHISYIYILIWYHISCSIP